MKEEVCPFAVYLGIGVAEYKVHADLITFQRFRHVKCTYVKYTL